MEYATVSQEETHSNAALPSCLFIRYSDLFRVNIREEDQSSDKNKSNDKCIENAHFNSDKKLEQLSNEIIGQEVEITVL